PAVWTRPRSHLVPEGPRPRRHVGDGRGARPRRILRRRCAGAVAEVEGERGRTDSNRPKARGAQTAKRSELVPGPIREGSGRQLDRTLPAPRIAPSLRSGSMVRQGRNGTADVS